jgi:hypothetical protein
MNIAGLEDLELGTRRVAAVPKAPLMPVARCCPPLGHAAAGQKRQEGS